ncbi:MAG: hypothetical protein RLN88_07045 [Ekhidna sp.]|uniref:hypothetical protein n=1 Tax=Ekhidna sp. TaxID=2608089 RepID=UPI0032EAF21F
MTLSVPKLGRRNAVLFTTLFLILATFAYYFLVYVKINESRFIDRAYRVLDRKATNIENKHDGYKSYLTFVFNSVKNELTEIISAGGGDQRKIQELNGKIDELYAEIEREYATDKINYEGINEKYEKIDRYQKSINQVTAGLDAKVKVRIKEILEDATPENVRLDYFFKENVGYERTGYYMDGAGFIWNIESPDTSYVSFSEGAESFVSALLSNGLFDEYILLKEVTEYDESGEREGYSMVYQTFDNPIDLESIGSRLQHNVVNLSEGDSTYLGMGPKMVKPVDVNLFNNGYKLLFHRLEIEENTYYLGGFVRNSVFKKESQKVEVFLVVIAILFILLLLIAMPVLKLVYMSSIERLHISNVVMTGGSMVLGVPIVLLIIFSIYEFVIKGNKEIDDNLKDISSQIETNFENEIGTIITKLNEFDRQLKNHPDNLDELKFEPYTEFNHIFWIDEGGVARANMQHTLLNLETSQIEVSRRDYFQRIVNDRMWRFTTDSVDLDFYLQSIVSWNDFTNEAAISIPSRLADSSKFENKYPVAVMTSQLHSVMDPIMQEGYGFAIIDSRGQVQFHSDRDRILQENFLEETGHSASIRSAMYSRTTMDADIKYRNVNHRAFIEPINSLPLYLVTFYNNEYRNAKIQGVVSLSVILLFVTFAVVCMMMLLLWVIQRRRSKLRISTFLFHWIKPDETKHLQYQFLTILFGLIGGAMLLMIANDRITEQDILFTFIITNAYLFLISFTWLAPKQTMRYTERPSERRNFNIAFISFIVVADIAYAPLSGGPTWWIVYQLMLTALVIFSRNFDRWVKWAQRKLPQRFEIQQVFRKNSYNTFLFSWLVISSVLPIFFIFMVSHNEEEIIWQKHNQMKVAEQYEKKVRALDQRTKALKNIDTLKTHFFDQKLNGGIYLLNTRLSTEEKSQFPICADSNTEADYLLTKIRPHYSDLIVESKGLAFDVSDERNRKWCFPAVNDKSSVQLTYKETESPTSRKANRNLFITTDLDLLLFGQIRTMDEEFTSHYKWIFRLSIILILICIYALIDYCTNKIYGREYNNFKNTLPLTVENFKRISIGDDSITHHKQRQIFLLGLPKSNKSNLIKSIEGNLLQVDMMWMNTEEKWEEIMKVKLDGYDGVVLENFEYGISSHKANTLRLKLLEKLTCDHSIQLIISSNVHPSFITDFYENKLRLAESEEQMMEEYEHSLETWRHVLGGFIVVHNPIKENTKINGFLKSSWIQSEILKQLFRLELNKGSFLPNLLPGVKDYFVKLKKNAGGDESKIDKEDIILRIQLLAESYYLGLWNTLSKEEKYIIYDLAKDRFVNINNKNGIRSLLEKGLLIYDNELRIMNESFTNFVLSIIKKEEALKMEKEVRDKGAWSTISSVLVLAVVGILAFLFWEIQTSFRTSMR